MSQSIAAPDGALAYWLDGKFYEHYDEQGSNDTRWIYSPTQAMTAERRYPRRVFRVKDGRVEIPDKPAREDSA